VSLLLSLILFSLRLSFVLGGLAGSVSAFGSLVAIALAFSLTVDVGNGFSVLAGVVCVFSDGAFSLVGFAPDVFLRRNIVSSSGSSMADGFLAFSSGFTSFGFSDAALDVVGASFSAAFFATLLVAALVDAAALFCKASAAACRLRILLIS